MVPSCGDASDLEIGQYVCTVDDDRTDKEQLMVRVQSRT